MVAATAEFSRIAAGRKSVGLRVVDEIDPRRRQAGAAREVMHHADEIRRGAFVHLLRVMGGERKPIGIPIGEEVGGDAESQGDQHAGRRRRAYSRQRRTMR